VQLQKRELMLLILKGWCGAIVSAAHEDADISKTANAWRESLQMLRLEEEIG
jgi:hypothetical protein